MALPHVISVTGGVPSEEERESAYRVAAQHREMKFGTIRQVDELTGVEVEYHPHKNIAFVKGDISMYFGYGAQVAMRCFCRGVELVETAGASIAVTLTEENIVELGNIVGFRNYTSQIVARVNGVEVGRVDSSFTSSGGTASEPSAPVRRSINIAAVTSAVSGPRPTPYALLTQDPSYTNIGTPESPFWSVASYNEAWNTPFDAAIEAAVSALTAAANQRAAVFMTDGTELASVPQVRSGVSAGEVWVPTFFDMPYSGGDRAPLFTYEETAGGSTVVRGPDLIFSVPDDVCYSPQDPPPYPGTTTAPQAPTTRLETESAGTVTTNTLYLEYDGQSYFIDTGTRTINDTGPPTHSNNPDGSTRNTNLAQGTLDYGVRNGTSAAPTITYKTYTFPAQYFADYAAWLDSLEGQASAAQQWISDWNAAQAVALQREHARRKRCSDGQLMYLRSGFLPPEIEYFVKTQHPVSALLKRKYPMQIINFSRVEGPQITNPDYEFGPGLLETQETNVTITMRYDVDTGPNAGVYTYTINGRQIRREYIDEWLHFDIPETKQWDEYEYIDFPNFATLQEATRGEDILPQPQFDRVNRFLSDATTGNMLVQISGIYKNTGWYATDEITGTPNLPDGFDQMSIFSPSAIEVATTIPQFLLDYIAASPPVEVEEGETPSTNWLSSRLADKEVVTVIPLSYVTTEGDDRGMFPLDHETNTDVYSRLKLSGYAKFRYSYDTGTFSFVSWTEFVSEGKVTITDNSISEYNDEVTPTSVTVDGTRYTLQPRYIDNITDWDMIEETNCVCIAGKVVWTDVKEQAKQLQKLMAGASAEEVTPDIPSEFITPAIRLYKAVKEAIR